MGIRLSTRESAAAGTCEAARRPRALGRIVGGAARTSKAALCALLLALSSAACGRAGGGVSADTEGARLYRRQCAICHGPEGAGGQVGALKVADLRAPRAAALADGQLFKQIYEGGNGMPPFKYSLSDQQIYDLVRFVRRDIQKGGEQRGGEK